MLGTGVATLHSTPQMGRKSNDKSLNSLVVDPGPSIAGLLLAWASRPSEAPHENKKSKEAGSRKRDSEIPECERPGSRSERYAHLSDGRLCSSAHLHHLQQPLTRALNTCRAVESIGSRRCDATIQWIGLVPAPTSSDIAVLNLNPAARGKRNESSLLLRKALNSCVDSMVHE